MSLPAERAPAPTSWPTSWSSWTATARTLARATTYSFLSGFVLWRWLVLVPLFGVSADIVRDILQDSFRIEHVFRRVDVWDLFPAMVSHYYMLLFMFGCSFTLLVGDSWKREQEQGAVALMVARMPSRALYWLSKMGALGLHALSFVGVAVLISVVVGMVIAPPPSALPMLPRESVQWMLPNLHMPAALYVVLLAGYTAWALWIAGCIVVCASLFIPHKLGVLGLVVLWVVAGFFDILPNHESALMPPSSINYFSLLDLGSFIGFYKHRGEEPMPLWAFFAITSALLVVIAVTGARRLRREEL